MSSFMNSDNWSWLHEMDVNSCAELLQRRILFHLSACVPIKKIIRQRGNHPRLKMRCLELVEAKIAAEATVEYKRQGKVRSSKKARSIDGLGFNLNKY